MSGPNVDHPSGSYVIDAGPHEGVARAVSRDAEVRRVADLARAKARRAGLAAELGREQP